MSITIGLDVKNAMQSSVGRRDGISEAQLAGLRSRTKRIHEALKRRRHAGELVFYDLPYMRESIIEVMSFAGEQIGRFENYVHVGCGGSALGPRALHGALNHPFHNYFSSRDRGGYPRLFFIDNFDPDTLNGLLAVIDPRETLFNVVSKSGNSAEAVASFLVFFSALKKRLGYAWQRQVIFTTDPENGDLRAVARSERIKTFAIHPMVGERFLLLTPAGLLPAAFSGIDVHGLLQGAIEMDGACRTHDVFKNPAYLFGAAHFLLDSLKGKRSAMMLPHADCLKGMAPWFQRLWKYSEAAASNQLLAKASGRLADEQTGIRDARTEETNDKVFTLLVAEKFRHETILPLEFSTHSSFQFSAGKTAEDILQSQQREISQSLVASRRPHLTITFPAVRPETVGEFVYMMHVAAVYRRELYAITESSSK
jgi:glucose-6-phosphate isomerase